MADEKNIFPNEVYKHFKGGIYTVLMAGTDTDTLKNKVIYQSHETQTIWIRDYDEFKGYKEVDGKQIKRFEYVGTVNLEQFLHEN